MTLSNNFALVIGISKYSHAPILPRTYDAEAVADVLRNTEIGNYPRENVVLLLEHSATRARILSEIAVLASRADANSVVFLYFSGHGARVAERDLYYLLPVDADQSNPDSLAMTAISG